MKKSKVWISVLLILLVLSWIGFDYLDYVNVECEALSTDGTALSTQTEAETEATTVATTEASSKPVTQAGTKSAVPNPSKQIPYIFRTQDYTTNIIISTGKSLAISPKRSTSYWQTSCLRRRMR